MKLAKLQEMFFIGPEPITPAAITRVDKQFRLRFGRKPNTARFDPTSMNLLAQKADAKNIPVPLETIFGMKIEIDPSLKEGEWRIGYSQEIIYEVEEQ